MLPGAAVSRWATPKAVGSRWRPVLFPSITGYPVPREMTVADMDALVEQFVNATHWSLDAGFEIVELHMAHGYLLHEFLSPLSNQRRRFYGWLAGKTECGFRFAWPAR